MPRESRRASSDDLTSSALVVVVPEAEPVVGHWRATFDPSAALGVPAHITLLHPFVPPAVISDDTVARVASVVAEFVSFRFVLHSVRWFGDSVVWLDPVPSEPFIELTGALLDSFPDYPRYGGAHDDDITPHLTIGDGARVEAMQRAAARVAADLPIEARASEVTLLSGSQEPNSWRVVHRFALRRGPGRPNR